MSALSFGQHLMIDGSAVSKEPLSDLELAFTFLDEFPARINMQKIMPSSVFWYDAKESSDYGLLGFVLIAESHMSIHTFPEKKFLSSDIFSCQVFNTDQAKMEIHDFFGLTKSEVNRVALAHLLAVQAFGLMSHACLCTRSLLYRTQGLECWRQLSFTSEALAV